MRQVRAAVGVLGELLITAGLVILLFVAWQLWWTDVTANRTQSATVERLTEDFREPGPGPDASPTPADPALDGDAFALLRIPRLGEDWVKPVLRGTGTETLREGLGHYDDTAAPGEVGNFAVAGHRTTWGRPLHDIERLRAGDRVVVETSAGWSVYDVASHEIVAPTDVAVIAPVPDDPGATPKAAWLTLTTCHPKYSATQRYIVHARLDRSYPRADGPPKDLLAGPKAVG